MQKETIELISSQTMIDNNELIEKTYISCGEDIIKTICTLMEKENNVILAPEHTRKRNVFDDVREILDEKARIYQNLITNKST